MSRKKDIPLGGGVIARPGKRHKHLAEIKTLYSSNFRNTSKTLRKIAKQLDSGELAPANEGALILDCADGSYKIFGFGPHYESVNSSLVCFELGAAEIRQALYTAKEVQEANYVPPHSPNKKD